jgi:hypothetical protein
MIRIADDRGCGRVPPSGGPSAAVSISGMTRAALDIGRPSIDPELMIRMLIVGYCFGVRSERRLCEEVHSIWPIAGFAGSGWMARFPIIRPSRRTALR